MFSRSVEWKGGFYFSLVHCHEVFTPTPQSVSIHSYFVIILKLFQLYGWWWGICLRSKWGTTGSSVAHYTSCYRRSHPQPYVPWAVCILELKKKPPAPSTSLPQHAHRSGKPIYGILGMISLALCMSCLPGSSTESWTSPAEYIIVVTGREIKGRLSGHDIFQATDFDILPLNPNISVLNPPHPVEAHLLALLRTHLQSGNFLFSYSWDLTRRLQAQWENQEADLNKGFWEVVCCSIIWLSWIAIWNSCYRQTTAFSGTSEYYKVNCLTIRLIVFF